MEISPNQKLNAVLFQLVQFKYEWQTAKFYSELIRLEIMDTSNILEQLEEDKYAISKEEVWESSKTIKGTPTKIKKFKVTFKGELFNENGGYVQREADIILQRERLKIDAQRIADNENWLKRGAVGSAIFAGCLLTWEIVKFLHEKNQIIGYVALYLLVILGYGIFRKTLP